MDVGPARRDHAVGVAVAAVERLPRRQPHALEGRPAAVAEIVRRARRQRGQRQLGAGARAHRLAVHHGRMAAGADPALAERRMIDDAEHRPPLLQQRDQGAEGRPPRDERFGAVDRIEDPHELGVAAVGAMLLADDAVRRIALADQLADRRLGLAVGERDRALVRLGLDRRRRCGNSAWRSRRWHRPAGRRRRRARRVRLAHGSSRRAASSTAAASASR